MTDTNSFLQQNTTQHNITDTTKWHIMRGLFRSLLVCSLLPLTLSLAFWKSLQKSKPLQNTAVPAPLQGEALLKKLNITAVPPQSKRISVAWDQLPAIMGASLLVSWNLLIIDSHLHSWIFHFRFSQLQHLNISTSQHTNHDSHSFDLERVPFVPTIKLDSLPEISRNTLVLSYQEILRSCKSFLTHNEPYPHKRQGSLLSSTILDHLYLVSGYKRFAACYP